MSTISSDRPVFTVVTLLHTKPEDQENSWSGFKLSVQWMRKHEGFVAACLHKSVDGKTILNYLQWRSRADFEAFINRPGRAEREREFQELLAAQGYGPPDRRAYEVVLLAEEPD